MRVNELIALSLLAIAFPASVLIASISQKARAAAFFGMIFGAAITYKLQINFLAYYWYHGTTRGLEISFVDILAVGVVGSCLLAPRDGGTRFFWPASLGWMLTFFTYACLSVLFAEPQLYGTFELLKLVRGLLVFLAAALYVRRDRDVGVFVLALSCAVCLQGVYAVEQRFLRDVDRVPGTLDHPNSLSMYLCMVSPVLVAGIMSNLPYYIRAIATAAIGSAAVALLLTLSRAGVPIFGLVMFGTALLCMSWKITPRKLLLAVFVLLCAGGLLASVWGNLKERYGEATLEEEYLDKNIEGRGYYLRLAKVIMADNFFGVGLNNWSYWVSKKYGQMVGRWYDDYDSLRVLPPDDATLEDFVCAAPAHNLAALTVGELGIPGLFLFALLWLRWFQMGAMFLWQRRREAMLRIGVGIFFGICGIFMQSLTEWTYRQTHIFLTFNMMLGVLAALQHARRSAKREPVPARAPDPVPRYTPLQIPPPQPCV